MEGGPETDHTVTFQDAPGQARYNEAVRRASADHMADGYHVRVAELAGGVLNDFRRDQHDR